MPRKFARHKKIASPLFEKNKTHRRDKIDKNKERKPHPERVILMLLWQAAEDLHAFILFAAQNPVLSNAMTARSTGRYTSEANNKRRAASREQERAKATPYQRNIAPNARAEKK